MYQDKMGGCKIEKIAQNVSRPDGGNKGKRKNTLIKSEINY